MHEEELNDLELYRPPETPFNPDLRIESRFKNARLYKALMDSFGEMAEKRRMDGGGRGCLPILAVASEVTGLEYGRISELLNLSKSPFDLRFGGQCYSRAALKLSESLCLDVQYLFPPELYSLKFPKLVVHQLESQRFVSLEAAKKTINHNLSSSPVCTYEEIELKKQLQKALRWLSPRQEKVIKMRFGLDGYEEHTLEEIGERLGCTRSNVRIIEMKALRKLRRPVDGKPYLFPLLPLLERHSRIQRRRLIPPKEWSP